MEKMITVSSQINKSLNFSMQQNYVPVIRSVTIHNNSEELLTDLELRIRFEPQFAKDYSYLVPTVAPGASVEINPIRLVLLTEFLFSLTERMVGNITIEIYRRDEKIDGSDFTIELLAYDQWSGLRIMPELIAAFVTPNHPCVSEVLLKAGSYLKLWTGSPSFTGYQTQNPDNVKKQMAAIYTALQSLCIVYNNPPASYEELGQRIRMPHVVVGEKIGTCLDLSVLYASCLEAAGLYPLIAFSSRHAYAGCRLNEETFSDCMIDDISAFEKRLAKGSEELLFVECTDFTDGNEVDFDRAVRHGCGHIQDISDFEGVVDIQRCRGSGIRPIPLRLEQARGYSGNADDQAEFQELSVKAPEKLEQHNMADLSGTEEALTKQRVWERKLLDFSLRNTLLNFRPGKNSLQIMASDLGKIEDTLSDGKSIRVMEVPSEWSVTLKSAKMYEIENDRDLIENISAEELKNGRVRTFIPAEELNNQLKNMFRSAKVSMEENGTNTMFLALGFLRWFESDISEKPRYAPIVLVPIDIVRNLRSGGYVIRSRQEEARINTTLLEYLWQMYQIRISGLDILPEDDHGIDLPLILHTVRQAIMGKSRWNIENLAFIGLFSFGQFVMWNDIRSRSDELKQNKVVSSLMDGKMNWTEEELSFDESNVESIFRPSDIAVPLSADSSQLVAVAAAAQGRSFVLHGPPGTGKSQTITNMIANALYNGKTVLFVAEKMAALSVVQKRLASIGLDPFCLELHSNKTSKTAVLSQLNKALEVGRIKPPEEFASTADKLYEIRHGFNETIEALHKKREYGYSIYEAIERYEANVRFKGSLMLDASFVAGFSEETSEKCRETVRGFALAAEETGSYLQNPWKGCELSDYSFELKDELERDLQKTLGEADKAAAAFGTLLESLGIEERSRNVCAEISQLFSAIAGASGTSLIPAVVTPDNGGQIAQRMIQCCSDGEAFNQQFSALSSEFDGSVLDYDVSAAETRLRQAQSAWFIPKNMGISKLTKELKAYAKNPASVNKNQLGQYYERIRNLNVLRQSINSCCKEMAPFFGGLLSGLNTNWDYLRRSVNSSLALKSVTDTCAAERKAIYKEKLLSLAGDRAAIDAANDIAAFLKMQEQLTQKYAVIPEIESDGKDYIPGYADRLSGYIAHISLLKAWTAMQEERKKLSSIGLYSVYDAWQQDILDDTELSDAFEADLNYALILRTLRSDNILNSFRGARFEDTIQQYKDLTERFRMLTINELVAKLSSNIPAVSAAGAASSEVGILKKAIKSNGRMMSIRSLFEKIPNLLHKICPCMLMSPISVAQYIDPSFRKFDLVIFDEASQLPTSEAVGTIARGENVIVVGDPNQLPPTNFFNNMHTDEDNMEMEDLESLLDDCLSISMPQEYLKWHYRSRHESLIAFSNMKYYDNKLLTFPSTNDLRSAVKFIPVEGCYDKGRTKQNRAEAEAVVSEIISRLSSGSKESIGVVTFSSVQQNLIDDLLAEAFVKNPELEDLDKASAEPIFIKNLENVQGDERDVILFSVGYGPDKLGRVSMNFGPLNRSGGWRRLNVAVSRARKEMIVYSTLRPEQIDLSRTRAEGVEGLKAFLEYAQRGKSTLAVKAGTVVKEPDRLIRQIASELERTGLRVKTDIGFSEYRIDIGIIDPDDPEKYILGIMLDGTESTSATSTDRFILQPSVLNGLGWRIMRLWTLEWLDDKKKVLKMITDEVSRCKQSDISQEASSAPDRRNEIEKLYEQKEEKYCSAGVGYKSYPLSGMGTPEDFGSDSADRKILTAFRRIIDAEAPISRKALFRKVISAWGITRLSPRVETKLDNALAKMDLKITKDEDRVFYWRGDQQPDEYKAYRTEEETDSKRSMDEISSYEIANAIREVLEEQVSLTRKDLIRETAKKFGYLRLGAVIENTISYAIDSAGKHGLIKEENGDRFILVK